MSMELWWNHIVRDTEVVEEKPVPVSFGLP